jgi:hypothetical protein
MYISQQPFEGQYARLFATDVYVGKANSHGWHVRTHSVRRHLTHWRIQFVGDSRLDLVRPHRRLVRGSRLLALPVTEFYVDPVSVDLTAHRKHACMHISAWACTMQSVCWHIPLPHTKEKFYLQKASSWHVYGTHKYAYMHVQKAIAHGAGDHFHHMSGASSLHFFLFNDILIAGKLVCVRARMCVRICACVCMFMAACICMHTCIYIYTCII